MNNSWPFYFIVACLVGIVVVATLHVVLGAEFKYNMTASLKQEDKLLPYCYNNKEMVIDALNHTCWEKYGGSVVP